MSLPPAIPIFLAGLALLLSAGQMAHARPSFPVLSIASDRRGQTTPAPGPASGCALNRWKKLQAGGGPVTQRLNATQSVIKFAVVAKVRGRSVGHKFVL
jgi:hypothetical protein